MISFKFFWEQLGVNNDLIQILLGTTWREERTQEEMQYTGNTKHNAAIVKWLITMSTVNICM